jgi:ABC-type glycerol-3-phosphate transport system substrate-binding protein
MEKKITRRDFIKGATLTAGAAVITACAPKTVEPAAVQAPVEVTRIVEGTPQIITATPGPVPTTAPTLAPAKLSYWGHAYDGRVKAAEQGIAIYRSKNPGASIDHQTLPDLWDKIQTAFASGTQPDVFSIDNGVLPRYAGSDLLVPIDPAPWGKTTEGEVFDLFETGSIDYLKYDNHLWGPPMEVSVHSPAYRLDHFAEYQLDPDNPPDTWQDWAELGQKFGSKFDDKGARTRQWFEWYNPGYFLVFLGPMLAELGGWWFGEPGAPALNTDAGKQVLQFFYDCQNTWKITDAGFASPDTNGHFVAGRETYAWHNFPGSRWVSSTFEGMEYGKGWKLQPMFKWKGVEARKNIGYAYGFFVTKASKQQPQAWQFIQQITEYPVQTEAWIDIAGLVQPYKGWTELPKVKPLPFVEIFNKEFEWSIPNILHPKVNEIGNLVSETFGRLQAQPPDSVQQVAEDYDKKLAEILA